MKKKLLILLIALVVIFLLIFLLFPKEDILEIINNTSNYANKKQYKYSLTLLDVYNNKKKNFTSKIIYNEIKNDNTYQFEEKYFTNDNMTKESVSYASISDSKCYLYYFDDKSYKKKECENINEEKDFNINLKYFLSHIDKISKVRRKYYKARMKTDDAFRLIYKKNNYEGVSNNVDVYIKTNDIYINEINFVVNTKDNKEKFTIKLELDYSLHEIELPIN